MNHQRKGLITAALIIAIAVGIIYGRGLFGPFLYDDFAYVVENPTVKSPLLALKSFGSPQAIDKGHFTTQVYRPLIPLVYSIVHALFGMQPFGFHLLNVLLHILNALLIFVLIKRLSNNDLAASLAALWWAVHPVHVESVQWISGLDDVLCPTFVLTALLLFISKQKALAALCFVLGLLSKEVGVMGSAFFFVVAFAQSDEKFFGKVKTGIIQAIPFVLLALCYVVIRSKQVGMVQDQGFWGGSLLATLFTMSKSYLIYLKLMVFPTGLRINYLFEPITQLNAVAALGLFALASTILTGIYAYFKRPLVALGILWFFVFMFPASNIVPILALVGERFLYLPLAGVALIWADIGSRLTSKRTWFYTIIIIGCIILGAMSFARVGVWMDEERFWLDIVEKEPDILGYQNNLGTYYARQKRYEEAERIFISVLQKRSKDITAAENLAQLYFDTGRYAQSHDMYRQLLKFSPENQKYLTAIQRAKTAMDNKSP